MSDPSSGGEGAPTDLLVRKDVVSLEPDSPEMVSLREGFRVLRERSDNEPEDPLGLLGQANIHRDSCTHATWWFLPWHRAYLYYFEQILREAARDPSLTLPYWDWTKDPRLPTTFWGRDNPLNDPTRGITPQTPADEGSVGQRVIDEMLGTTDFFAFASERSEDPHAPVGYGILEGTPHNYIHRFVGRGGGNMMNPDRAAQDPIFWLHHANVDHLWAKWVEQNPGRTTTDPDWLGRSFDFFDVRGDRVSVTTAQTLNTNDLNYRYDTQEEVPVIEEGRAAMVAPEYLPEEPLFRSVPERTVISGEPLTVTLNPAEERMGIIADAVGEGPTMLRLQLDGVVPPGNADVGVRVFINLPDADASTPVGDPHYVTTFTFFEHEGPGHEEHANAPKIFYANVTPAVQRLQDADLYTMGDSLEATLVTVPIVPEDEVPEVEIPFEGLSISARG